MYRNNFFINRKKVYGTLYRYGFFLHKTVNQLYFFIGLTTGVETQIIDYTRR